MDVVCGRCKADYEFDDALISERGTTVRCTSCGLQFKIFPPAGTVAPEVWRVQPADGRAEPYEFESLRDLQRAIGRGELSALDRLSRADEPARALSEIAELQALLRQPQPVHPGAKTEDREEEGGQSAEAHQTRAPTGTVMGIAAPRSPGPGGLTGPPPEAEAFPPEDVEADGDEDAIVPPSEEDALDPAAAAAEAFESASREAATPGKRGSASTLPRIQSVLSRGGRFKASPPMPGSTNAGAGPSLRSTLGNSRAPAADAADDQSVDPSEQMVLRPPPLPRTEGLSHDRSAPGEPPTDGQEATGASFSDEFTPTPTGVGRGDRRRDSSPVSSAPGTLRGARSGLLVLVVILGAGGFFVFSAKDRLFPDASAPTAEQEPVGDREPATAMEAAQPSVAELERTVQRADVAWLKTRLVPEEERLSAKEKLENELQEVDELLAKMGEKAKDAPAAVWSRIHLLRMNGDLQPARSLLLRLSGPARDDAYGLALLDLAEPAEDKPYPLILRRLKEAATGERGLFLARSAYIYALAESGKVNEAMADWEALGELKGGPESPLYQELGQYLERRGATSEDAGEPARSSEGPPADPQTEQREAAPAEAASAPRSSPTPAPEPAPTAESAAAAKTTIDREVKGWMDQADALWGQGDRQGAMRLYKRVVSSIGTGHFLGQRASARIGQAQRELQSQ